MSKACQFLCLLVVVALDLGDSPRSAEAGGLPAQATDNISVASDAVAGGANQSAVGAASAALNGCTGNISPLYRYWNGAVADHFYTTSWAELGWGGGGYSIEGTVGSLLDSSFSACGAAPLYRYYNPSATDHFYTTSWAELGGGSAGWYYEGVQGYCFPFPVTGSIPLYRYWNGGSADHFYTTNFAELGGGSGGYVFEGVQCYVSP
jgi:Repeat of unknown function (DUF5648)